MKVQQIIWGLILVSVGGILLLANLGDIDFYWRALWHYWPVILVLIGINMLFSRNNSAAGAIVAGLATCIVIAFLIHKGTASSTLVPLYDESESGFPRENTRRNMFSEPFLPGTRRAELNISGGASSYLLQSATPALFDANVRQVYGSYSLKKISAGSAEILNFRMNERSGRRMGEDNNVILRLNAFPVWDIDVKLAAGSANFDLTRFNVSNLTLEGGAVSFKAKLGQLADVTNIRVKSAAADIDISVPGSAGCRIRTNSGLSSKDFNGFKKESGGIYTTSNFASSSKKIMINIEGAFSNIEVKRY